MSSSAPPLTKPIPAGVPPAVDKVRLFGPVVLNVTDSATAKPGEARMFDHPLLEWLTRMNPWSLPVVYVPLIAYYLWRGSQAGFGAASLAGLFIGGWFVWTFIEYLIHRFAFHLTVRGRASLFFTYLIHGVHHAYPDDSKRWVMPPAVSLAITLGFHAVLRPLLGEGFAPLLAGGAAGYLAYDMLHFAVHRGQMPGRLFRALRRYHFQHHYASSARRFGVSTPLWDYVFNTAR